MSDKDKMEQVLKHNPKVSKSIVAEYRELSNFTMNLQNKKIVKLTFQPRVIR